MQFKKEFLRSNLNSYSKEEIEDIIFKIEENLLNLKISIKNTKGMDIKKELNEMKELWMNKNV